MKRHVKKLSKLVLTLLNFVLKPSGYKLTRKNTLDLYLHEYKSYEEYRRIQILHYKRKITNVWADEKTLQRVADIVKKSQGEKTLGLCHGTRNGFEQNYLSSLGVGIFAIGTDISETALDYENSVQWDFHDVNDQWVEKFDFIYTNSLDQSWRPQHALQVWLNQLKPDGALIIEHTRMHDPTGASEMDPFGVRPEVFPYVLTMWFGDSITISHSKSKKKNKNLDAWLFVLRKSPNRREFRAS